MTRLYTKDGRPLKVSGSSVYAQSGEYVGRIRGDKVFHPSGRYAGTIVGDRVVYRHIHSARVSSPSSRIRSMGFAATRRVPSSIMGQEPDFPD